MATSDPLSCAVPRMTDSRSGDCGNQEGERTATTGRRGSQSASAVSGLGIVVRALGGSAVGLSETTGQLVAATHTG
jgi:hypothetical protein